MTALVTEAGHRGTVNDNLFTDWADLYAASLVFVAAESRVWAWLFDTEQEATIKNRATLTHFIFHPPACDAENETR